jgi:hypothetical protein
MIIIRYVLKIKKLIILNGRLKIDKFENLVNTSKGGKGRGKKYKLSYLECKEWVKDNLSYINTKEKWYSTLDTYLIIYLVIQEMFISIEVGYLGVTFINR